MKGGRGRGRERREGVSGEQGGTLYRMVRGVKGGRGRERGRGRKRERERKEREEERGRERRVKKTIHEKEHVVHSPETKGKGKPGMHLAHLLLQNVSYCISLTCLPAGSVRR